MSTYKDIRVKMRILDYKIGFASVFYSCNLCTSPKGLECNYFQFFFTSVARAAAELLCLVSGSVDQWIPLGGSQYILPQNQTSVKIIGTEICGLVMPS